jgi:hypothetical protein
MDDAAMELVHAAIAYTHDETQLTPGFAPS